MMLQHRSTRWPTSSTDRCHGPRGPQRPVGRPHTGRSYLFPSAFVGGQDQQRLKGSQQQGAGAAAAASSPSSTNGSASSGFLSSKPALGRKVLAAQSADEVVELLLNEQAGWVLSEAECIQMIVAALDKGNLPLARSIYASMSHARRADAGVSIASVDSAFSWPPASIKTTSELVLGLCRQLLIEEAITAITDIRKQGLPKNDAVGFGKVVGSPLAPKQTLTVVQPQEGCKIVADAFSRYEYELFSGTVINVKSEALLPGGGLLATVLRVVGILRRPAPAAVHEFVVQAPDGVSRTFRVATPTADVPAQKGERITFVCAPGPLSDKAAGRKRQQGLLSPSPPGTKPGEAMTATNHKTGVVTQLLPPPLSSTQSTIPSWVLPTAVLLAGGDAASSLLDPTLPALIAAGTASVVGTAVAGNTLLIPKLKQLPEKAVSVEYTRQQLLGQYSQLSSKVDTVVNESSEDVRVLARLWQLQNKMQSVASGAAAAYGARMERVAAARANIEERLVKKLELLDGYARVMNMIEIEVEMDIEVPAAELAGIAQQMERLSELESLQDDWRTQAEARDEVERLLRSA